MSKRRLKRQLNLLQVIMLGTAGTIAAEVFVLTGHAAALSGPAVVLAVVVAGLLSYSIALNYCELASMYPVTGGALTYVREAWGTNLLSFLVGSLDCLSSTFYSALQLFTALFSSLFPHFRNRARTQTPGSTLPDIDAMRSLRMIKGLRIGIYRNKINPIHLGRDHTVHGITAAAANTNNFDGSQRSDFRLHFNRLIGPVNRFRTIK